MMGGDSEAAMLASRKKGLRRTFLQEMAGMQEEQQTLGGTTALGQYGGANKP